MSQKYSKYRSKKRSNKITLERQIEKQRIIDQEKNKLFREMEETRNRAERERLRKSVWEDDFEFGGAL